MNVHRNLIHVVQNTHLRKLCETLIQSYIYSNLTLANLWIVTNVVLQVCLFNFGFKKDRLAF